MDAIPQLLFDIDDAGDRRRVLHRLLAMSPCDHVSALTNVPDAFVKAIFLDILSEPPVRETYSTTTLALGSPGGPARGSEHSGAFKGQAGTSPTDKYHVSASSAMPAETVGRSDGNTEHNGHTSCMNELVTMDIASEPPLGNVEGSEGSDNPSSS